MQQHISRKSKTTIMRGGSGDKSLRRQGAAYKQTRTSTHTRTENSTNHTTNPTTNPTTNSTTNSTTNPSYKLRRRLAMRTRKSHQPTTFAENPFISTNMNTHSMNPIKNGEEYVQFNPQSANTQHSNGYLYFNGVSPGEKYEEQTNNNRRVRRKAFSGFKNSNFGINNSKNNKNITDEKLQDLTDARALQLHTQLMTLNQMSMQPDIDYKYKSNLFDQIKELQDKLDLFITRWGPSRNVINVISGKKNN